MCLVPLWTRLTLALCVMCSASNHPSASPEDQFDENSYRVPYNAPGTFEQYAFAATTTTQAATAARDARARRHARDQLPPFHYSPTASPCVSRASTPTSDVARSDMPAGNPSATIISAAGSCYQLFAPHPLQPVFGNERSRVPSKPRKPTLHLPVDSFSPVHDGYDRDSA